MLTYRCENCRNDFRLDPRTMPGHALARLLDGLRVGFACPLCSCLNILQLKVEARINDPDTQAATNKALRNPHAWYDPPAPVPAQVDPPESWRDRPPLL